MIYIVPLTIFGDKSASAARKLLKTPPFSPDIVTRFYRGDVLFPGVDQAVGIVRVRHSQPSATISVSGGDTLQDAKSTQFQTDIVSVIEAVPQNGIWQGNWLVAQSQISLDIWEHVKQRSNNFSARLGNLLDAAFETRQGDVNATLINPLRIQDGSFAKGNIAIYKGEDIEPYAPLPSEPSDWVDTTIASENTTIIRSRQILEQLKQAKESEQGIVLRQVARLNTREHLKASWFERTANAPTAFTNELWRMLIKPEISEQKAKSLLAFLNGNVIAYLINLFSTNNHVSKDELDRVPIPSGQAMPTAQLARLADELLNERASLEKDLVHLYNAQLPEGDGEVYIPPSAVLATTRLPKITLMGLVGRGAVKNTGPANGRIRSLRTRNLIVSTLPSTDTNAASFAQVLMLFLSERSREDDTWGQAQNWQLPDPVAATAWLQTYTTIVQQAQAKWERFMALQREVDTFVADWYGFNAEMRAAIAEGLPWARRRKNI